MSKWKPGQLVTINRHVYRVVKVGIFEQCCGNCNLFNVCSELHFKDHFNCVESVGVLCYFKKVI